MILSAFWHLLILDGIYYCTFLRIAVRVRMCSTLPYSVIAVLLMLILYGATVLSKGMLVHLVLRLGQSRGLLLGQGSYH